MKSFITLITACCLLCSANALITRYDPFQLNGAALILQKYYMYDNTSTPATNSIGNGQSFLELSFNITRTGPSKNVDSVAEVYIAGEEFYESIGYIENEKRIVCCDSKSYAAGRCKELNKLISPRYMTSTYTLKEISLPKSGSTEVFLHYDIPVKGKYYMILSFCDASTSNLQVTGDTLVMNPYGHLPARLYGLLPFTGYLCVLYVVLLGVWLSRYFQFYKEIMSVHSMILCALMIFLIDTVLHHINIKLFNIYGYYSPSLSLISAVFSAVTRTFARFLTLVVAMGLGVTCAAMGTRTIKTILVCLVYFALSLWDALATAYSSSTEVNYYRLVPAAIVDSLLYFWILHSLLHTIAELEEKHQSSKLAVFLSLRNMIIAVILLSTLYNLLFSYLVVQNVLDALWRYQWFFSEGVWSLFYVAIIICIMYLWAPNERSLAYAYHVQVATDEQGDTAISLQDGELQPIDSMEHVKIETVDGNAAGFKPMNM